ncbi:TspO/MBR related protein [Litoreibacter ponti]|uniref:TspO/MBR related protein n=1 Tax=Litoreibacter ponti TaxID=1510457 RepID=A0A2T6BPF2_9RHOB|nr:TspO/MBR family protein [Litoreibacter ponti]PTX57951.1 TspO/MBR related protein [Litoreibacter ponti]
MDWMLFVIFLCACFAAGTTGAVFMPGEWYRKLDKPDWTPPDWVFPLTWTTLYICMSFAGARIAVLDDNAYAVALWALQIALNTLWTPIFFGLRRLGFAMGVIVALWISVAACLLAFLQLDFLAAIAFAPYLVWVTIAAALNYSVWRRNPDIDALEPDKI